MARFGIENSKRGLLPFFRHGIYFFKGQSPKTLEEKKRMSKKPYASADGSLICHVMHLIRYMPCYAPH